MTKTIAENHGLRATFMPKPFTNLTGNGCHSHISVWDKSGKKNLFLDKKNELGLSKKGYNFLGGVVHSADKMAAIFNPTVNSYKRINGTVTLSGATWSPSSITWAGNNRTHMVRVPGPGRFELRLMDGASNPYLLQAGSLMLGLDGISNERDPGKRLDINMYTEGHKAGKVKKLPLNLLDSIRNFDQSKIIREGFGNQFVDSYVKLKNKEWESYNKHLSESTTLGQHGANEDTGLAGGMLLFYVTTQVCYLTMSRSQRDHIVLLSMHIQLYFSLTFVSKLDSLRLLIFGSCGLYFLAGLIKQFWSIDWQYPCFFLTTFWLMRFPLVLLKLSLPQSR